MEGSVNVNAVPNQGSLAEPGDAGYDDSLAQTTANRGPCLYLGSSGQRCHRQAVEGGFCARHQPGGAKLPMPSIFRRALGIAGVLAVLWPLLADLVRELLRFLR